MSATKTPVRATVVARPKTDPPERESVSALIDRALSRSREADPHVIAKRLLSKLSDEQRDDLALIGLLDRVSKRIQLERAEGLETTRSVGPSKWSVAQRVCVAGDWKLLENCDLSDLHALAEQHKAIAEQNLARALEFEELAARLHASGCATVGEMWASAKGLAA